MNKTMTDIVVAGGLTFCLLFVVLLDRLMPTTPSPSGGTPPRVENITQPPAPPPRLAVSETNRDVWDDMAKLLKHLGEGYKYKLVHIKDLYNPRKFEEFDILFLTCSSEGNDNAVAGNVRDFVARGGTLYASDWRYEVVRQAFPDLAAPTLFHEGDFQILSANVLDAGLQDVLGKSVQLKFDMSRWKPAAFKTDRVRVLMDAEYDKDLKAGRARAPLLVKFPFGKGSVIFTSFHNEQQNSEIEHKLLKYLVLSAVTAQTENQVNQTMLKGGFSPQKSNLLSASGRAEISQVYRSDKAGPVRFVLGFENRGAKLKLSVSSPSGKKEEAEGLSTITIEMSDQPGDWRYTVTALEVPFADFPFTMTVGAK
ncbi:MAG: hypothetical protein L0Y72_09340 [Gemmataceae bacterium]|nr:hypothetical protein [Gemmataceae bacterium]MCI0739236.1 hypothetical protein [Gemmataceae bacterium]